MSQYQPKPGTMRVVSDERGWTVWDEFGPYEGPYTSERDAYKVIASIEGDQT